MKTIDFTQPGGFPLSQERLGYMQTSYKEALGILAKIGAVGTAPIKLWGMLLTPSGYTGGTTSTGASISDGAFFYNNELYLFTGGSYSSIAHDLVVVINSATTPLVYNDSVSRSVIKDNTATFADIPTVTDATHFPISTMKTFAEGVFNNSVDTSFVTIGPSSISSTSGGVIDGFVYYRKMPILDALHVLFQFSALSPTTLSTGSTRYHVFTLPTGYIPYSERFIPVCCYSEPGMNDAGTADLRFGQFYIDSSTGYCYIDMSKHSGSSYERYMFSGYIPLIG
jgi:hypothetical protein